MNEQSNVETILFKMISDIKERDKADYKSLAKYVNNRLDKSVQTYYEELLGKKNFLSKFNELSVAKKLNKM